MRRRLLRFIFWALLAVPLAIACGADDVLIPDLVDASVDSAAQPDGQTDAAAPDTSIADAAVDVVCPTVTPDDMVGVYVSTFGMNTPACGTLAAPCKTIAAGIARARLTGRPKVYVARGAYVERLKLFADIEIIGGWEPSTWTRACVSPQDAVLIRAPDTENITVEASNIGGVARLSLLRIESKLEVAVDPGDSLFGVVAYGGSAATAIFMNDVDVVMVNAGAGSNGRKGDAGADGGASCAAGDGGNGPSGSQGPGAPAGGFGASGYDAGIASPGGPATVGGNGTTATKGSCVTCGSCDIAAPPACKLVEDGRESCGTNGTSGCGGAAGGPGGAALGGGTNIAVYAWAATITISGGNIKSGNAGNGGTGGAGGAGGSATKGIPGDAGLTCIVACSFDVANNVCVDAEKAHGLAGDAGGAGGIGGTGGTGGGGGGGSSYAVYAGGAGVVTTTSTTTLGHGTAGMGGGPDAGAGANGLAADRVP